MTHSDLVERATRWLLNTKGCTVVFTEFATGATEERPDAIGFKIWSSILVECKVSRADFLADRKKTFRTVANQGMGQQRYYMMPEGMVGVSEIPERWGLLYVKRARVIVAKESSGFPERQRWRETGFLVSMLRRAEIRAIDAHHAAGNDTRPADFLNHWLKWGNKPNRRIA